MGPPPRRRSRCPPTFRRQPRWQRPPTSRLPLLLSCPRRPTAVRPRRIRRPPPRLPDRSSSWPRRRCGCRRFTHPCRCCRPRRPLRRRRHLRRTCRRLRSCRRCPRSPCCACRRITWWAASANKARRPSKSDQAKRQRLRWPSASPCLLRIWVEPVRKADGAALSRCRGSPAGGTERSRLADQRTRRGHRRAVRRQ